MQYPYIIIAVSCIAAVLIFLAGFLFGRNFTNNGFETIPIQQAPKFEGLKVQSPESELTKSKKQAEDESIGIPGYMRLAFLVEICEKREDALLIAQQKEPEPLRELYWVGRQNENKFFLKMFNQAIEKWDELKTGK